MYSEEDFTERPPYTQPEIQRPNLAEVILRMKAFRLGDIETFPFVNPPPPAAIDGGYRLLQELGALDAGRRLTPLGENLSRLPIDPTLGRMLLQSQQEHATHELLIIAAGLSIQDPRERPLDNRDAAAAAHKRFADPQSDFLTLLKIWDGCMTNGSGCARRTIVAILQGEFPVVPAHARVAGSCTRNCMTRWRSWGGSS